MTEINGCICTIPIGTYQLNLLYYFPFDLGAPCRNCLRFPNKEQFKLEMDYFLSDYQNIPENEKKQFLEKLLLLFNNGYFSNYFLTKSVSGSLLSQSGSLASQSSGSNICHKQDYESTTQPPP